MKTSIKYIILAFFFYSFLPTKLFSQNLHSTFNGKDYLKVGNQWKVFDNSSNQYYDIVDNVLTIRFNSNTSQNQKDSLAAIKGLSLMRSNLLGYYDYQISVYNISNIFEFSGSLQNATIVDEVLIPCFGEYVLTPNDPQYSQQWYMEQQSDHDIDIGEAWDISTGNQNIIIGILDSGTDWDHEDLGLGNDTYQNIHLNTGEDAWTSPNNPLTGNGLDDDGNGYIDDWKGYNFALNTNDARSSNYHGTHVAGIVAAKSNNNTGIAGIAGGWASDGCKLIICNVGSISPNGAVIDDAIIYAVDKGAKIIQLSLTVPPASNIDNAIQYANDNGVIVVCASGNGFSTNVSYPANNSLVLSVGSSDQNDFKAASSNHGINLDISAPGVNIRSTRLNNTYGTGSGTSFAAPIVSGVAALMLSVNSCLSPNQIKALLNNTADKVGGYNYNWNENMPDHSFELGYGRVNANKAILAAQEMLSPTLDLYMRDRYNDLGYDAGYPWTWDFDDSPDIWVRNQDDGLVNQVTENPEYQAGSDVFVYVRVANKSCVASEGGGVEKLALYWTKASSNSSWPQNWDGSTPTTGNNISTLNIPILQPGESTILTFTWPIQANTGIGTTWHNCLLARIEGSSADPITVYPDDLGQDVYQNNNISMRNCVVTNYISGIVGTERERFFYVGNPYSAVKKYDIIFRNPENTILPISQVSEIDVILDQTGWNLISPYLVNRSDIKIKGNYTFSIITNDPVVLKDVTFPANLRLPMKVAFNFLTDKIEEKDHYKYHLLQKRSQVNPIFGDHWTGGIHFYINKAEREKFNADAGEDLEIDDGQSATLSANQINEDAEYNWYDSRDTLIYTGENLSVSPNTTETYKLEIIADADGFKDYDEVEVKVNRFRINGVSPNPTANDIVVDYTAQDATSVYFIIVGATNSGISNNYVIDSALSQTTIDVSSYPTGVYTIALVVNGQISDAQSFVKQ